MTGCMVKAARWMSLWAIVSLVAGCAGDSNRAQETTGADAAARVSAGRPATGLAALDSLRWAERLGLERAMAAQDPVYAPRLTEGVASLVSPRAGAMQVDAQGARLDLGVTVALSAIGRPGAMRAVGEAQVAVSGPVVERHLPDRVVEWWRALPSGLEHGVTVSERPTGVGVLVLEVAFEGLDAEGDGPALVLRDQAGALRAHYGHLLVHDAAGAQVPARMVAGARSVRIEVEDDGAAYPLVVDPLVWTEEAHLFASDGATSDMFGSLVSLSADGSRALVGAPNDDGARGSAYVFVRSGTAWSEEAHLFASDGAVGDRLGDAVSLSADGSRALVGASFDNTERGSAYVFVRSATTWSEEARLFASVSATFDSFGRSVSLSGDGSRALVGADGQDAAGRESGSAYVFARVGAVWSQEAHLIASDGAAYDYFGRSVSLSADGGRALVGAYGADTAGGTGAGSAYVFTRLGSMWVEEAHMFASDGMADDNFGRSVSLSAAGGRALVGALRDEMVGGPRESSAYVFVRSATTWTEESHLFASDGAPDDSFAISVSLSGDGNRALVGSYLDDLGTMPAGRWGGSAYLFVRSGTTWTEEGHLFASDGAGNDLFGRSVSLSVDGSRCVIGASGDSTARGMRAGSAYVFELSDCAMGAACVTGNPCERGSIDCRSGAPVCVVAGPAPVGTECRAAVDACDVAETCNGATATCPADARMPGCATDGGMDASVDSGIAIDATIDADPLADGGAVPDSRAPTPTDSGGCCTVTAGRSDSTPDLWLLGALLPLIALGRQRRRR